jgi:hypothetical protein
VLLSRVLNAWKGVAVMQGGGDAISNVERLVSSAKLRVFSILQGLVVLIVNVAVQSGMTHAVKHERLMTYTSIIASEVFKLSLFYLINSFIIPIAVIKTMRNSDELWCAFLPCWHSTGKRSNTVAKVLG